MEARQPATWIIFTLLISVCVAQIDDCNMKTELFSHRIQTDIRACSEQFHQNLQAYYPTAEQFMKAVEIQPPRSLSAPVSLKYSSVGDSIFFSNTSNWGEICQLWVQAAECLEPAVMDCGIALAFKLLQDRLYAFQFSDKSKPQYLAPEYAFSERTCESGKVRADLQKDLDNPELDLSCLTHEQRIQFKQCVNPLIAEVKAHEMKSIYSSVSDKTVLDSMSGSVLRCIRNMLDMSTCNTVSQKIWAHIGIVNLPAFFVNPPDVELPSSYDFSEPARCTVGAYGDPHFRLCSKSKLLTCSLPGQHIFLSNHFVEIRATNSKIPTSGMVRPEATAITRIQITFKSVKTSESVGMYIAESGNLPETFNGFSPNKIGHGDDAVTLSAMGNKRTFIQAGTGTIIIIRKWGDFFHFTLRMSEKVINDSYGVLLTGCTMLQKINTNGWIQNHRSRMKRDVNVDHCIDQCNPVATEFGLQKACAFDCGVTGNAMFVNMSMDAWKDMVAVGTRDDYLRKQAIKSWIRERGGSSSACFHSSCFFLVVLFSIITVLLSR
ncbi:uncharacterized protein LOC135467752 [Liolophura sinensis]|uniref:uncharacterized protein LOC135467752 n=1 Tax=Liolophura sinensis TaxID=3198878 RepID=UPI003158D974